MKKASYICPALTAFAADGSIDLDANRAFWAHLIKGGVSGILISGSCGEFYTLTHEEKLALTKACVEFADGRVEVLGGSGCNTLEETIQLSNEMLDIGADGVLIVSPYYFSLGDDAIVDYYAKVAAYVHGNVLIYNYPQRTGNDVNAHMLSELLERADNIVGFKDTVSEIGHTRAIIEAVCHTNTEFRTFSGFDENFMHVLMAGGNGCIAGLSNVFPELAAAWIEAANNSDISRIEMIQKAVDSLMSAYDISPLFVPVFKRMVAKRGIPIKARCRCTALGLGKEQVIAADDLFETGEKLLGTLGIIK